MSRQKAAGLGKQEARILVVSVKSLKFRPVFFCFDLRSFRVLLHHQSKGLNSQSAKIE
jgi:hypothetical protein